MLTIHTKDRHWHSLTNASTIVCIVIDSWELKRGSLQPYTPHQIVQFSFPIVIVVVVVVCVIFSLLSFNHNILHSICCHLLVSGTYLLRPLLLCLVGLTRVASNKRMRQTRLYIFISYYFILYIQILRQARFLSRFGSRNHGYTV